MRQLTTEGHITFARVKVHPNGVPYLLFAQVERNPRRVVLIKRRPDGGFDLIKEWKAGTPPFTSHPGDGDFAFLPDGSIYVVMPFSVKSMGDKTALFEETLPQAAPPFTPAEAYTYVCSATDDEARIQAKAAIQAGQRAELLGKQALDRAREDGATNERRLREIGEGLKKSMADVAWSKAGDRIYDELSRPDSPLRNRLAEAAETALRRLGLIRGS